VSFFRTSCVLRFKSLSARLLLFAWQLLTLLLLAFFYTRRCVSSLRVWSYLESVHVCFFPRNAAANARSCSNCSKVLMAGGGPQVQCFRQPDMSPGWDKAMSLTLQTRRRRRSREFLL